MASADPPSEGIHAGPALDLNIVVQRHAVVQRDQLASEPSERVLNPGPCRAVVGMTPARPLRSTGKKISGKITVRGHSPSIFD